MVKFLKKILKKILKNILTEKQKHRKTLFDVKELIHLLMELQLMLSQVGSCEHYARALLPYLS